MGLLPVGQTDALGWEARLSVIILSGDDGQQNGTKAAEPDSGLDGPLIAQMSNRRAVAVEMMNDVWPALSPSAIRRSSENNGNFSIMSVSASWEGSPSLETFKL